MISAEAPVLFAKACEFFIQEMTLRAWNAAEEHKRRTLQRGDIATAISRTEVWDFLLDTVPLEGEAAAAIAAAAPQSGADSGAAGAAPAAGGGGAPQMPPMGMYLPRYDGGSGARWCSHSSRRYALPWHVHGCSWAAWCAVCGDAWQHARSGAWWGPGR